jgi:hypothetical protein
LIHTAFPYELFRAFNLINYNNVIIGNQNFNVFSFGKYYDILNNKYPLIYGNHFFNTLKSGNEDDFFHFLCVPSILPCRFASLFSDKEDYERNQIPTYDDIINEYIDNNSNYGEDEILFRYLYDALLTTESPRIFYIHNFLLHGPFLADETGHRYNLVLDDPYGIPLYYPQYKFTSKFMIKSIDMILKEDPEAIIILQADHGTHLPQTQRWALNNNYSLDRLVTLHNSVLSAVRIPEKWGGLMEPLDPINISRLLINRYVGYNYQNGH